MTKRKAENANFDHGIKKKKKGKPDKAFEDRREKAFKNKGKKARTPVKTEIRKPVSLQGMLNQKLEKAKANRLSRGKTADGIGIDTGVRVNISSRTKHEVFENKDRPKDQPENKDGDKSHREETRKAEISEQEEDILFKKKENREKKNSKMYESEDMPVVNDEVDKDLSYSEELAEKIRSTEELGREINSELKQTRKKKKKKAREDPVIDSAVQKVGDNESGGVEDEDPEKAALRKKKREKRKQKKLERERKRKEHAEKAGTAKVAAVDYLKQWKNDRETWKFQKVRQVWLLQNMYDQMLLDDESFEILLEYLEGLQGKAREKTVSEAETTLEKNETEEDSSDAEVRFDRAKQVIQLLSDG